MNILTARKIITIKRKDEINLVLQRGKKIYFKFGLIFLYKDRHSTDKQAAVLVKRSIGNAVKRNRVKRLVRQFFRNHYQLFDIYNRIIVLINKKADLNYQQLEENLIPMLKKR